VYLGSAELFLRDRSFWRGAGDRSVPATRVLLSPGSLVFDIDTFFDDFDREGLQQDVHGLPLVTSKVPKCQGHSTIFPDTLLRQRCFAMRAEIGGCVNLSIHVVDGKRCPIGTKRVDFTVGKSVSAPMKTLLVMVSVITLCCRR
jgi:hypothetical protein